MKGADFQRVEFATTGSKFFILIVALFQKVGKYLQSDLHSHVYPCTLNLIYILLTCMQVEEELLYWQLIVNPGPAESGYALSLQTV